jgi:hypothetical protein
MCTSLIYMLTMLLEVLLGRSNELDGGKLVTVEKILAQNYNTEYLDRTYPRASKRVMMGPIRPR